MTRQELETALAEANQKMQEALQEKTLLDLRISQLSQTINALNTMLMVRPSEVEPSSEECLGAGITEVIRRILMANKVPQTPVQIKIALENAGYNLTDYANKMAVIHNTLKRLTKQGEMMTVVNPAGEIVAYTSRWRLGSDVIEEAMEDALSSSQHPIHKMKQRPDGTKALYQSGMRGNEKPKK